MDKLIKEILESYKTIGRNKEKISEASSSSNELFGGKNVTIPADGEHAKTKDWQSAKAWDIQASKGTPVYALADGTIRTMKDYGSLPYRAEKGAKRLYGYGFTVDGMNGSPNVYYAHLENVQVQKGDTIKCGQLIGFVGDSKWIKYDHVHVGVEPPAKIQDLITRDGKIKCSRGSVIQKIRDVIPSNFKDVDQDIISKLLQIKNSDSDPVTNRIEDKIISAFKSPMNLKSILGLSESEKIKNEINNIFEDIEESANDLRQVAIGKYGWTEKSGQLSGGGDLNNDLTKIVNEIISEFSSINSSCKGKFSAGNDQFHHNIKSYTSRHTKGEAVDVVLPSNCHRDFMNLLDKYKSKYYGFNYIDEYRNPTSKATGGHFHLSYRPGQPEGGKKSTGPITKPDTDFESSETGIDSKDFDLKNKSSMTDYGSDDKESTVKDTEQNKIMNVSNSYDTFVDNLLKRAGLQEEKIFGDFGNKIINTFGSLTVPKSDNKKIFSPVEGVVNNSRFSTDCRNQLIIDHEIDNKIYHLKFCGISDIKVRDGQNVYKGTLLGNITDDVQVSLLDGVWDKQYITPYLSKEKRVKSKDLESSKEKKKKTTEKDYDTDFDDMNKKPKYNVYKKEERYKDPIGPALLDLITSPFRDKYDEDGKLVQKRWAYPTDKVQPEPFIKNFYKKYDPTRKKVKEDVERIKKLLK